MPSPRQVAAAAAVGRAVRSGTAPGTPSLAERVRLAPAMLSDSFAGRFPALSRTRLAMLLLGLTDDVLVGGWVVATTLDAAGEYATWRKQVPYPVQVQPNS